LRNKNRLVDKTFLSADHADERVIRHRDQVAHTFRWANVARHLARSGNYKGAIVLEGGCGRECPLAKMLYSNRLIPLKYVGVDIGPIIIPDMIKGKKIPAVFWPETDFCAMTGNDVLHEGRLPNVFVSFEVLEHQLPSDIRKFLIKAQELTSKDCNFFISTPCWDGYNAADNHLSEMTVGALGSLFEDLGYKIEGMWGTFASQKDYKPIMESRYPGITEVYEKLSEYYDSTVISLIFAPLFPMESRNCLWHLTKAPASMQERMFSTLSLQPGPWSQHPDWRDLDGAPNA